MAGIFEKAQEFHKKTSTGQLQKAYLTNELKLIIESAPFLQADEKRQMLQLIPMFNARVIRSVKDSLIRQGLRYFQSLNQTNA